MTRYGNALSFLVAGAVLIGCSGSSSGGSSSAATSPTPGSSSASPSASQTSGVLTPAIDADLSNRLLRKAEWPGATAIAATQFFTPEEAAALHPDAATEGKRLAAEGLVALAAQQMVVPGSGGIVSVTRFRTPAGASAEAKHSATTAGTRPFAVTGVPGALGFEVLQNGAAVARNIAFVSGAYIYTVGTAINGPNAAQLSAIAKTWYDRVSRL